MKGSSGSVWVQATGVLAVWCGPEPPEIKRLMKEWHERHEREAASDARSNR